MLSSPVSQIKKAGVGEKEKELQLSPSNQQEGPEQGPQPHHAHLLSLCSVPGPELSTEIGGMRPVLPLESLTVLTGGLPHAPPLHDHSVYTF